ncbi:MAG: hypothetical protein WC376_00460 [Candidatus Nanoarchaeia archaeon]|jgi:hypothetical protein
MAETVVSQAIELINSIGILDVFVKFILGFAITFGILEKTAIFGSNMQRVNAAIAASIGVVAVLAF